MTPRRFTAARFTSGAAPLYCAACAADYTTVRRDDLYGVITICRTCRANNAGPRWSPRAPEPTTPTEDVAS